MIQEKIGMKVILIDAKNKIKKQIAELEYTLKVDTNLIDKHYHDEALAALKNGLEALETVENKVKSSGRKKTIDDIKIIKLKTTGKTQQEIAQILDISISSVTRACRENKGGKINGNG